MFGSLPRHVREVDPPSARHTDDSLFWPSSYLFPEVREQLWPLRQFPLPPEGKLESLESLIEIQTLGLQYCVHVQMKRDPALLFTPPSGASRHQGVWTNLPVFAEEPCEWHYPQVQHGYNVNQIEPPSLLRPELNVPRALGYLPNGDLLLHRDIAEPLADEFDLDIEPLRSSIDGHFFVTGEGCDELDLMATPVGKGCEAGILLSRSEQKHLKEAIAYLESLGASPVVFPPGHITFYRLLLPVMQCEFQMNRYLSLPLAELGLNIERLASYALRVLDNPRHREEPLFSTERGNLIISRACLEKIKALAAPLCPQEIGECLPLIRTP